MKKVILTLVFMFSLGSVIGANAVESNDLSTFTDCFGEAIEALEYYDNYYDFTPEQETELLNIEYALCWLRNQ